VSWLGEGRSGEEEQEKVKIIAYRIIPGTGREGVPHINSLFIVSLKTKLTLRLNQPPCTVLKRGVGDTEKHKVIHTDHRHPQATLGSSGSVRIGGDPALSLFF